MLMTLRYSISITDINLAVERNSFGIIYKSHRHTLNENLKDVTFGYEQVGKTTF